MKSDKPLNLLVQDYIDDHQGTASTKQKYSWNLRAFVSWLGCNTADPRTPTLANIIDYISYLRKEGRSEATVVAYIVTIRQWFKYLEDCGIYRNVANGLKASVKDQVFKKKPLQPDQVKKLLASINRSTEIGKRDYALINLMVRLGCRCCEVSRLNVDDFYIEDNQWLVRLQRKGMLSKADVQGLSDKSIAPIKDYFEARDLEPGSPAFINYGFNFNHKDPRIQSKHISRIIKERLRSIDINDPLISAHSLRHTAAVTALDAGIDVNNVSMMLGHRDIKTTLIYLRYIRDQQKKKGIATRAVDKMY